MNIRYKLLSDGDWLAQVRYMGDSVQCVDKSRVSAGRGAMWYVLIRACTLGDLPRGPQTDQTFKSS